MNYLIIDDDLVFAETLARGIVRRGFDASIATNSEQALQIMSTDSVECVVLDLKIGEESGLNLLTTLKTNYPGVKVVLLTGYSSIPTAVEAIKLGAHQYLCKPARLDEVLDAFADHDSHSQAETEIRHDPHSVGRLEWEHIQKVLMENDDNISATARALGMHRRTLQRKLQKRPVQR